MFEDLCPHILFLQNVCSGGRTRRLLSLQSHTCNSMILSLKRLLHIGIRRIILNPYIEVQKGLLYTGLSQYLCIQISVYVFISDLLGSALYVFLKSDSVSLPRYRVPKGYCRNKVSVSLRTKGILVLYLVNVHAILNLHFYT